MCIVCICVMFGIHFYCLIPMQSFIHLTLGTLEVIHHQTLWLHSPAFLHDPMKPYHMELNQIIMHNYTHCLDSKILIIYISSICQVLYFYRYWIQSSCYMYTHTENNIVRCLCNASSNNMELMCSYPIQTFLIQRCIFVPSSILFTTRIYAHM